MRKKDFFVNPFLPFLVCLSCIFVFSFFVEGAAVVGKKAPNFQEKDNFGKMHSLSQYKGKYLVIEFTNYDCPFVKKHYEFKNPEYTKLNMQSTQKDLKKEGVIWLSVISSGKGKQGNFSPKQIQKKVKSMGLSPSVTLLDYDSSMAKTYGATRTPSLFLIDKQGFILSYKGTIDSIPSTQLKDLKKSKNYLRAAFQSLKAGKKIDTPVTEDYGCSIKWAKETL